MAAYVIFIREGEIVDQGAMDAYAQANGKAAVVSDLKPLVIYGEMETIEGEPCEGMVVLEFPDMDAARTWYNGDYLKRAQLRQKAAPYRGFIVQGM